MGSDTFSIFVVIHIEKTVNIFSIFKIFFSKNKNYCVALGHMLPKSIHIYSWNFKHQNLICVSLLSGYDSISKSLRNPAGLSGTLILSLLDIRLEYSKDPTTKKSEEKKKKVRIYSKWGIFFWESSKWGI